MQNQVLILQEKEPLLLEIRQIVREEIKNSKINIPESSLPGVYVPPKQAAEAVNKCTKTLDNWHRGGTIKKEYINGQPYYFREEIENHPDFTGWVKVHKKKEKKESP